MGLSQKIPGALQQLADEWERRGWRPADVGAQLRDGSNRRAAGERVRAWLSGRNRITLDEAEQLADKLGGRIVLVTEEPFQRVDAAISGLPPTVPQLKRHLRALLRSERSARASPREEVRTA